MSEEEPKGVTITDIRLSTDTVLRLTLQVMWVGFLLGLVIGIVWYAVTAIAGGM